MPRPHRLLTCLLGLALALASMPRASSSDWTGFLGGPHRTASSDEQGLLPAWPADGPPLLWETAGVGYGFAEVLVVGENVYTHGRIQKAGSLQCLDRLTGLVHWKVPAPANDGATPAWYKGRLYVSSRGLTCFDAKTGALLWQTDVRKLLVAEIGAPARVPEPCYMGPDVQSPLVHNGLVVLVLGQPGAIAIAVDAETGKLRWVSKGEKQALGRSWSSPSVVRCSKRDVILAPCTGDLVAIDPADGKVLWEERAYPPERSANGYIYTWASPPVYADGFLFLFSGYKGNLLTWTTFRLTDDGARAERAWNIRRIGPCQENVVCANGLLFGSGALATEDVAEGGAVLIDGKPLSALAPAVLAKLRGPNRKAGGSVNLSAVSPGTTLVCQDLKSGAVKGARGVGSVGGFSHHLISYADNRLYMAVSGKPDAIYLVEASPALTVHGKFTPPFDEMLKPENQPVGKGWGTWGGYFTRPQVAQGLLWVRALDRLRVYDLRKRP